MNYNNICVLVFSIKRKLPIVHIIAFSVLGENMKKITKDKIKKNITIVYLFGYSIFLALFAMLGGVHYAEIDSYALPVISMQYRGSLTMEQSDLVLAQRDFPELYSGVNSFDDLRASKLVKTAGDPDVWVSYYFPVYGMAALPFKLLLQFLGLPQERAFTLLNACSIILALALAVKILKIPDKNKFVFLLLVSASPLPLYCCYISAEAFMCGLVIFVLVLFHEKHYRIAAILVMLASWMNPTVLMFGLPMIAEYFVNLFKTRKNGGFWKTIFSNFGDIVKYAACYIGFVVPFIFNIIFLGKINPTMGTGTADGVIERFGAYLFDLNFGFASFAFIVVLTSIITFPVLLVKKRFECAFYYAGLVLVVAGYSVTFHINCGMLMCARYVLWSYPILAFIVAVYSLDVIKEGKIKDIGCALTYISMVVCLFINSRYVSPYAGTTHFGNPYTDNSNTVKAVLNTFPELYNPMPSTFYSRVLHIDGGYNNNGIAIYSEPDKDYVRKIALLGSAENKAALKQKLICVSGDSTEFDNIIERIPEDNQYHYLDFNCFSSIQVKQASLEEQNLIKEKNVICNLSEMNMPVSGSYALGIYSYELTLNSNTYYKIHCSFDEESLKSNDIDVSFIDFYGPNYDNFAQEQWLSLNAKRCDATCYINSGEVPDETGTKTIRIVIQSKKPVVLNDFSVVEMCDITIEENDPDSELISCEWSDDFYPVETDGDSSFRWCSQSGSICVTNNGTEDIEASIDFAATTLYAEPYTLTVSVDDSNYTYQMTSESEYQSIPVTLKPGTTNLSFSTDAPRLEVDDPRTLYFRIWDFEVNIAA